MDKYTSTLLPQDNTKEENQKATLDLLAKINALVDDVNSQIDATKQALIPVGFVYTQWPGMVDPATLWPFGIWANISSTFPGAFPRVEGGNALAFGAGVQNDAFQGHFHESYSYTAGAQGVWGATSAGLAASGILPIKQAREPISDGVNGTPRTANETRPTNYTVRIWRRTA